MGFWLRSSLCINTTRSHHVPSPPLPPSLFLVPVRRFGGDIKLIIFPLCPLRGRSLSLLTRGRRADSSLCRMSQLVTRFIAVPSRALPPMHGCVLCASTIVTFFLLLLPPLPSFFFPVAREFALDRVRVRERNNGATRAAACSFGRCHRSVFGRSIATSRMNTRNGYKLFLRNSLPRPTRKKKKKIASST